MVTNYSTMSSSRMLGESGISWGWLLALGILLTALGVIGLGITYWLTLVAVFWFGVLAVIGGIAQLFDAFHHKRWGGVVWHAIIGAVYIIAGILLVTMPVSAAFWLTLFLAVALVVAGIARIIMAFQVRGKGRVWLAVLLSGVISIVLGVLIYTTVIPPAPEMLATVEGQIEWIRSWGWVIGLFVAIELIMEGVALILIAMAVRSGEPAAGPRSGPIPTPAG